MSELNPHAEEDCPLPAGQQSRNLYCFAGFWCLYYLTAPVTYIGVPHANLLKALEQTDEIANLPHAYYQWMSAVPIVVAWLFPQPRLLKPLLVVPLILMAGITSAVSLSIWLKLPATVVTKVVIAHGAVFGACNGVLLTTLWEVLRRGVSTSRRGHVLGLTFGVGPILACVGSLVQRALFENVSWGGISLTIGFPKNYLVLFAAVVPLILLESVVAATFIVPLPLDESVQRTSLAELAGGLRKFFTERPLIIAAVTYLLVSAGGSAILDNVSLHAKEVLQETTATTMGTQSSLRFGFKAAAGGLLGWLLVKTSPKTLLLTTTSILLFGMTWALSVSGWWYLVAFGWLGAGELYGVYFPNYIATASAKSQVRANMSYLILLSSLVGFASVYFGKISDRHGHIASFYTAAGILVFAMLLIAFVLPAKPTPRDAD